MNELETRARRAGEAARDEARLRLRELHAPVPERRHRRTPRAVRAVPALVAGLVVVVVVGAIVVSGLGGPSVPLIDDRQPSVEPAGPVAVDGVLPVPAAGEALAAYLEDGRPVFVSHPEQGEVVVLDALDPHGPWGWQKLVAYCPSSGWFEEPHHGARFNGWGEWTDGPAPAGLAPYPSELAADGETVRVVGPRGDNLDRSATEQRYAPPKGPPCDVDAHVGASLPLARVHRPPSEVPEVDGRSIDSERWSWVAVVLGGTTEDPRVCDADGTCPEDAPTIAGIEVGEGRQPTLLDRTPRILLARASGDGDVEILLPAVDLDTPHPLETAGGGDAEASAEVAIPDGWQTLTAGEIAVSVPEDWEVYHMGAVELPLDSHAAPEALRFGGPCLDNLYRVFSSDGTPVLQPPAAVVYDTPTDGVCLGNREISVPPPQPGLVLYTTIRHPDLAMAAQPSRERVDIEQRAEPDRIGVLDVWRVVDDESVGDLESLGIVSYVAMNLTGGIWVAHTDDPVVERILDTARPATAEERQLG